MPVCQLVQSSYLVKPEVGRKNSDTHFWCLSDAIFALQNHLLCVTAVGNKKPILIILLCMDWTFANSLLCCEWMSPVSDSVSNPAISMFLAVFKRKMIHRYCRPSISVFACLFFASVCLFSLFFEIILHSPPPSSQYEWTGLVANNKNRGRRRALSESGKRLTSSSFRVPVVYELFQCQFLSSKSTPRSLSESMPLLLLVQGRQAAMQRKVETVCRNTLLKN